MEQVTCWPVVPLRFSEACGSSPQERERLRLRFAAMSTAELKALDGKPCRREELLPAMLEAFKRGLMDSTGEARLLALLDKEEAERLRRHQAERFRLQHGGLSREEMAALKDDEGRSGDSPAPLTEEEKRLLRLHGIDVQLVQRMEEVRSLEDYRRVKAEVDGRAE